MLGHLVSNAISSGSSRQSWALSSGVTALLRRLLAFFKL
jgi:hypothetical protein